MYTSVFYVLGNHINFIENNPANVKFAETDDLDQFNKNEYFKHVPVFETNNIIIPPIGSMFWFPFINNDETIHEIKYKVKMYEFSYSFATNMRYVFVYIGNLD